ncbi:MAG: NrfD/PsrC family molybdoenzyme membrane anchor subunit [Acidobacteriota bacterium]
MENRRLFIFKGFLWILAGLAVAIALLRFALGLGASTALSDTTPWGLWIGFGDYTLMAVSAGGFVLAAMVHIFHGERLKAAARPAILMAFLGYAGVVAAVIFDLGLPWNVWHPVVFWNIHSPLFEVSWCIMLYLTVLTLELLPVILERTRFRRTYGFLKKLSLPIIILGIMLSTLHQSSVGSMLLIMPFRIYPLWYSHLIPELFFVSAICLGIMSVMFVSFVVPWLYKKNPNLDMISALAGIVVWILAFYGIFRMTDLAFENKLGLIFSGSWESNLFIVEMLLSTVIPIIVFAVPAFRRSPSGLLLGLATGIIGFTLNRIDTSGLVQVWATRWLYIPAWGEIAINVGYVAALALVFLFIEEHFPVDPQGLEAIERERALAEKSTPRFAPFTQVWLGEGWRKSLRVYSMLFVLAMAVGLTLAPKSQPAIQDPVQRGRGEQVLRLGPGPRYVYFDHVKHQEEMGGQKSCGLCHHLHKPGDVGTPCSDCHRQLYTPSDVFNHNLHVARNGGDASCVKCHGQGSPLSLTVIKRCSDCHQKDMMAPYRTLKVFHWPPSAITNAAYKKNHSLFDHNYHVENLGGESACVRCHGPGTPSARVVVTCSDCHLRHTVAVAPVVTKFDSPVAVSYKEAMHKMCIPCHVREAANPMTENPNLGRCGTCHNSGTESEQEYMAALPKGAEEAARP